MSFRINRGVFQFKDTVSDTFINKFKIDDRGDMVEVDEEGNKITSYMRLGDKAHDADLLDGIDSGSFLRSNGGTYSIGTGTHFELKHTTSSGYSEMNMSNNSGHKLVFGSIGTGYTNSAWAGSRYIYSTAGELRIKAATELRLYSGGMSHTGNLAVTFDTASNAFFTGNSNIGGDLTIGGAVTGHTNGVTLAVGSTSTYGAYVSDNARNPVIISGDYYPHLFIVAQGSNNSTHGGVISFVGTEGSTPRQWNMGISNRDPFLFSIGYNRTGDTNPHYGLGDNWNAQDYNHARLSIDRDGNTKIRGSLYVNGTKGGITTGSKVATESYATGAADAVNLRIEEEILPAIDGKLDATATAVNADTVDGYHATNAGGGIPVLNANGYWDAPSWINVRGTGLYSSNTNGAHFYPNNKTYGSWKILGTKGGWYGLHFGEDSGVTLMMNESESGIHREGSGWKYRHTGGKFYVHTGTNGGGTGYPVWHEGNLTPISYATGSFTVGGDPETYYPVMLNKSSRTTGRFVIYRDNVHQDESSRGAGRLVLNGYTSGWGHVPLTLHYETKISGSVLWKFLASNYRTGLMVVYLKGATTYYYKSEHGFTLHDANGQGEAKSDGRTSWLPTPQDDSNAAWEGETPSVLTIEHGVSYYDGTLKAGRFKGDGTDITNVDAQTLDGIDGGSFLRSDANDTMSGNLTLKYSTSNTDEYNALIFAPGSNDYIIKASSTRGAFGRQSFGWHVDEASAFGVYSNGWTKLFGVEGGTGNAFATGTFNANQLTVSGSTNNARLYADEWGIKVGTDSGHIQFGPANNDWAHIYTDRPNFYFNKNIYVSGSILSTRSYAQGAADAVNTALSEEIGNLATAVTDNTTQISSNRTAILDKLSISGKAADSNLLDGIDSSGFVQTSGNQSITGTKTFSNSSIVIQGSHASISFIDDTSGADDFYLHANSNNFYVLSDRDGSNTVDGGYDSPHPMQLESDTNSAYFFGNKLNSAAYQASSAFDAAGAADAVRTDLSGLISTATSTADTASSTASTANTTANSAIAAAATAQDTADEATTLARAAQTTADGKLGSTAKAADSNLLDGIDSSRFVYGANARRSERYDQSGIVSPNQNSGFYYGYDPDGAPFTEWWNWLTVAGASWTSGNNYDFKLAHNFHADDFYVSRMANGVQSDWRKVWDTGNFDPTDKASTESVAVAQAAAEEATNLAREAQTTADSKLGATAKAADSNLLDGIDSGAFLRSNANDTFTSTLIMGTQKALVANNYGRGVYGLYDSYRYQHVWSMGTAYNLADNGTSTGNLYGISWTHSNVGGESISGLGHQMLIMSNGDTRSAIGDGIWTKYNIYASGGNSTNWNAAYSWGNHAGLYDSAGSAAAVESVINNDVMPPIATNADNIARNATEIAAKAAAGGSYSQDFAADDMRVDRWFRNTVSGNGLYNEATTQHWYSDGDDYWNIAGGGSFNAIRFRDDHAGTQRGLVGADSSNRIGFLDAGGAWAVRHDNDSGTLFYTDGETLEFRVGRDKVTGDYGTVQTDTTRGSWGGYSIAGRVVFMHDHSNGWGIYNDVNNEWMIYGTLNGQVELRHNSAVKLSTNSGGVTVTGTVTATTFNGGLDWANVTNKPVIPAATEPVQAIVEGGDNSTLSSITFSPGEGSATFTLADGQSFRLAFAR